MRYSLLAQLKGCSPCDVEYATEYVKSILSHWIEFC